jgi:hypothetical protein
MIRIELKGLTEVTGYLEALRRNQLPYATMLAVNDLAFEVRSAEIDLIKRVFDRPKPQTARNIFVKKATKEVQSARIRFDQIYGKDLDEYMKANVSGGQRLMKPSERRLGRFFVPGVGAKMDAYGNMQGGQITQILSRLGLFGDVSGYDMNQTAGSIKRRSGGSKATEYFMITQRRGGLVPGIYQRTAKRGGFTSVGQQKAVRGKSGAFQSGTSGNIRARGAVPIMIFTKSAPKYQPRWPFFQEGQRIIDTRFKDVFTKRIADALRTAR